MSRQDPYIAYTHRFFRKWLPFYDLFAWSIFNVYTAAARRAHARTLLDICTGTGEMALRCATAGAQVTAIDITEPMLAKARKKAGRLPIDFRLMDARRLEFADASFEVSLVSLALHDMPRRVRLQVLREACRVTSKRIVILDYEFPEPRWLRRVLIGLVGLFETAYFKQFASEGLRPLLEEAGLRPIEVVRLFPPLFAVYVVEVP